MTIITTPSVGFKKTAVVDEGNFADFIETEGERLWMNRKGYIIWLISSMGLVFVLFLVIAMFMCFSSNWIMMQAQLYEGSSAKETCPELEDNMESGSLENKFNEILEPWTSDPDVQVVDITNVPFLTENQGKLHEQLKMTYNMTMIVLQDKNKPPVTIFHDFDVNLTTIKDDERCFIMSLDPELVVPPAQLLRVLARGAELNRAHTHTVLEVVLPALPSGAAARCHPSRPAYALRDPQGHIRKRSAEEPRYHYALFSGRRVQTLELTNLPRVRRAERTFNALTTPPTAPADPAAGR